MEPKKGGGGARNWGKPGDELKEHYTDPRDPNYESDKDDFILEEKDVATSMRGSRERSGSYSVSHLHIPTDPPMSLEHFKEKVTNILVEYLTGGEHGDAVQSIRELNCPYYHDQLVKRAIVLALDRSAPEQELVSAFLTLLCTSKVLRQAQLSHGFDLVLDCWEDLTIDVPLAPELVLQFIACAIRDGCLDAVYLTRVPAQLLERGNGASVLADLRQVTPDAAQLARFKTQCADMVMEYFDSSSADEVANRLKELNQVQFHHELVRKALLLSLDRHDRERELVNRLFAELHGHVLTTQHMEEGFLRMLSTCDDVKLDVPNLTELLANLLARAVVDEVIPPKFLVDASLAYADSPTADAVVRRAESILDDPHASVKLHHVWSGESEISAEMDAILNTLEQDGDVEKAAKSVRESDPLECLSVLVSRAVLRCAASGCDRSSVVRLLSTLYDSEERCRDQFASGVESARRELSKQQANNNNNNSKTVGQSGQPGEELVRELVTEGVLPHSFA